MKSRIRVLNQPDWGNCHVWVTSASKSQTTFQFDWAKNNAWGWTKIDLTKYLESPNYKKEVAFIEKFHDDFSKIVNAYAGKDEKIYVFIDDLDRCELGKSADLLQALNLMISNDPNIIFFLGMDREKVAAAITFKQKHVLPYLASISGENQE